MKDFGSPAGGITAPGFQGDVDEHRGTEDLGVPICGNFPEQMRSETVIAFDWDDTLLPTSWLERMGALDEGALPSAACEQVAGLCRSIAETLHAAAKVGKVIILTNSSPGWVEESCRMFMPQLLDDVQTIPCTAKPKNAPADFKTLALWRECRTFHNVISVGDGESERCAAMRLQQVPAEGRQPGSEEDLRMRHVKSIKFADYPSCVQLICQHDMLAKRLKDVVAYPGFLDLRCRFATARGAHTVSCFLSHTPRTGTMSVPFNPTGPKNSTNISVPGHGQVADDERTLGKSPGSPSLLELKAVSPKLQQPGSHNSYLGRRPLTQSLPTRPRLSAFPAKDVVADVGGEEDQKQAPRPLTPPRNILKPLVFDRVSAGGGPDDDRPGLVTPKLQTTGRYLSGLPAERSLPLAPAATPLWEANFGGRPLTREKQQTLAPPAAGVAKQPIGSMSTASLYESLWAGGGGDDEYASHMPPNTTRSAAMVDTGCERSSMAAGGSPIRERTVQGRICRPAQVGLMEGATAAAVVHANLVGGRSLIKVDPAICFSSNKYRSGRALDPSSRALSTGALTRAPALGRAPRRTTVLGVA